MPNIHFIGFSKEKYEAIKIKVDVILKKIGLDKDAVTTFHPWALVESCDGRRIEMPYIHIFSSTVKHILDIKKAFIENELFLDIESSDGSFIDAATMREK